MGKVTHLAELQRERSVVPGRERVVFSGPRVNGSEAVTADLLVIKPGGSAALHWHTGLDAHFFFVLRGRGTVVLGDREHDAFPGCFVWIEREEPHRLHNPHHEDFELLEFFIPGKWETHLLDGTPQHLQWLPIER